MKIEVQKATGTYADSLQAIGVAGLLEEVSRGTVTIRDRGYFFEVESINGLPPEEWQPPGPGFYYVWLRSKEKERPPGVLVLDYENERQRAKAAKESKNDRIKRGLEDQGLQAVSPVDREYRPAAILASMRKGWSSDKDVYLWVSQNGKEALEWVRNELVDDKPSASPLKVKNSQFYNPVSGKGVHSPKTTAKSPGAISSEIVEPFAEWMKYRGAYQGMLAYRQGDDFKLFVIEPGEIEVWAISFLRTKLLDLNLWGGIRLDIEASLRLAEILIMHSDVMGRPGIRLRSRQPAKVVKGLRQAFFKGLGTAAALMNDAFLPLPSWFRINDRDDANAFMAVIKEHIGGYYDGGDRTYGCLGSLREDRPDNVQILQQYRDWLNSGDPEDLLEFLARFAVHVMQREARVKRFSAEILMKRFSAEILTILFKRGYGMKEIVENAGFLSVARAIRNATVTALWLRQQGKDKWDVRFGLAQKWKQKMKGGAVEFIPVLADFVQDYNWEVANRLEGKAHVISKHDLDQVVSLITNNGNDRSELVGMLLLAYGFAKDPRAETDDNQIDTNEEAGQ